MHDGKSPCFLAFRDARFGAPADERTGQDENATRAAALLERGGDIVTHHELLATMRGVEHLSDRGYLRIYIRQLREKLEDDPQLPLYIRTEWGMGYRLLAETVDVQERRAGNASAG